MNNTFRISLLRTCEIRFCFEFGRIEGPQLGKRARLQTLWRSVLFQIGNASGGREFLRWLSYLNYNNLSRGRWVPSLMETGNGCGRGVGGGWVYALRSFAPLRMTRSRVLERVERMKTAIRFPATACGSTAKSRRWLEGGSCERPNSNVTKQRLTRRREG